MHATEMLTTKTVWVLGHRVTLIPCGDVWFALEITSPPGVPGPPPHFHDDSDEMFHVFEGALEIFDGTGWSRLEAGRTTTVPRGGVHTFRNPTDGDVRWLTGWNPVGFQDWFAAVGVEASLPNARERSVADDVLGPAVEACARFGMTIVEG